MLEIRYIKATSQLTAWCGDEEQFGCLDRGRQEEATTILDIPIPLKHCTAYLYDSTSGQLTNNPNYAESPPARNLAAEIDELKAKIKELKDTEK